MSDDDDSPRASPRRLVILLCSVAAVAYFGLFTLLMIDLAEWNNRLFFALPGEVREAVRLVYWPLITLWKAMSVS